MKKTLSVWLASTDMVRTFNLSFSLKTTVLIICLHCLDKVAVSDLVYRFLLQNVSSDFFKRHILLNRLNTFIFIYNVTGLCKNLKTKLGCYYLKVKPSYLFMLVNFPFNLSVKDGNNARIEWEASP